MVIIIIIILQYYNIEFDMTPLIYISQDQLLVQDQNHRFSGWWPPPLWGRAGAHERAQARPRRAPGVPQACLGLGCRPYTHKRAPVRHGRSEIRIKIFAVTRVDDLRYNILSILMTRIMNKWSGGVEKHRFVVALLPV